MNVKTSISRSDLITADRDVESFDTIVTNTSDVNYTSTRQPLIRITKVMSSNPVHGEVYSIQHYVIMFVSDLRQMVVFLWVLPFPPPIKLILLKVALNTIVQPWFPSIWIKCIQKPKSTYLSLKSHLRVTHVNNVLFYYLLN